MNAMFFAIADLGPSAPFVGILLVSFALASALAGVAVLALPKRDGQQPSRARKTLVWLGVCGGVFLLWGSSSGHGGPLPGGGITGYTHGGILHYITVTSHQPGSGSAWSHDISLHTWPLVGTVALSAAALIGGALVVRRWRTFTPVAQ
jgi:hypothetical protein